MTVDEVLKVRGKPSEDQDLDLDGESYRTLAWDVPGEIDIVSCAFKDGHAQWLATQVDSARVTSPDATWLNLIWYDPSVPELPSDSAPSVTLASTAGAHAPAVPYSTMLVDKPPEGEQAPPAAQVGLAAAPCVSRKYPDVPGARTVQVDAPR